MKKIVSFIVSAAFGLSALCSTAYASEQSGGELVVLGDSISAGYGLNPDTEYDYGQICADYLGYDISNYAVNGYDTEDLISLIESNAAVRDSISGAEVIVISVGGNDIMQYISKAIIDFAAKKGYLNDGYTADNIPEKPSISELNSIVKLYDENGGYSGDCLLKYMKDNQMEALSLINTISGNLRVDSDVYEGYIINSIMPNIEAIRNDILELNSDAQVIFQTVYQPIQFSYEYFDERFGTNGEYASMKQPFTVMRTNLNDIMGVMRDELLAVENISVADVYYEFTALEDISESIKNKTQGSAHYFTDIQEAGDKRDIHPNQKGHIAIAAAVLEQIGKLHDTDSSCLLRQLYEGLEDKADYPALPLETYNLVVGSLLTYSLGDINGDGVINPSDATLVLRQYAAESLKDNDVLNSEQKACADVNSDAFINPIDATLILNYYSYFSLGGRDSFEDFIDNN